MREMLIAGLICLAGVLPGQASAGDDASVEEESPSLPISLVAEPDPAGTEELPFLEIHGYYRFRADLFDNFDLNQSDHDINHGFPEPLTEYNDASRRGANTLAGANMRLRLEPVLNIHQYVKVYATLDLLDNVVLGSNPDTYCHNRNPVTGLSHCVTDSGLMAFSQTQVPPSSGVNSLTDSIVVKRVYGEIKTPLGLFRVGRMASHWGMGVMANGGNGYDDDYGDTVDRVMFVTGYPDWDLYLVPALDWVSEGPTSARQETKQGQAFDADQLDDVNQYVLAVVRRQSEEKIEQSLDEHGWALNGGMYNVFRKQVLAIEAWDWNNQVDESLYTDYDDEFGRDNVKLMDRRDAELWAHDIWARLDIGRLAFVDRIKLEFEGVWIHGHINGYEIHAGVGADQEALDIDQKGFVARLEGRFLDESLRVHFEVGYASGDKAMGWGNRKIDDTQKAGGEVSNFSFDPDYKIDMILWREIIGAITDALYFRPKVEYHILPGIGVHATFIYSMAEKAHSTPSAGYVDGDPLPGASNHLGLEMDLGLFVNSEQGFDVNLDYGVLFPFDGLERRGPGRRYSNGPDPAQTLQFRVTWHF